MSTKAHTLSSELPFFNHKIYFLAWQQQEADSDPSGEAAQTTQQTLTFYELDLGLNHVVRKYSEPLEEHGNMLIAGKYIHE